MNDLIAWLRAQFDEDAREARDAACANPGSAADRWSAEKVDHRSDDGVWRKTWAIVPERVEGIVLAVCPADITPRVVGHIARHDPARVLREVAAKRVIVDLHQFETARDFIYCKTCGSGEWPCNTLLLLAAPYADRPGYREEWTA